MDTDEKKSEVARLMQQIAMEYQAAQQGLTGLAYGTSLHQFITQRLEHIGACHEQLAQLVGDEQAAQLVCSAAEQPVQ